MRLSLLAVLSLALVTSPVFSRTTRSARNLVAAPVDRRAVEDCRNSAVKASATYSASGSTGASEVRLRISNGGAGQSGLVGALTTAYIDYALSTNLVSSSFSIDWITGDTTDSIRYLSSGDADIAITYNAQAEYRALGLGVATRREYGFRDHFLLVGPRNNTANLTASDTVLDMFNKLVTSGDTPGFGTRFLSRFDRSATNIKESLLFSTIGQTPWAYSPRKWYHLYPQFPLQALTAAALLGEYTLSDRGTFLTLASSSPALAGELVVYAAGADEDPKDLLLNPASFLLGGEVCEGNKELAEGFLDWVIREEGGQAVVGAFRAKGSEEVLYSRRPECEGERGAGACDGW